MKIREKYRVLKKKIKEILFMTKTYSKHIEEINTFPARSVVLWGIPEYGNLGDQAITYAEIDFISKQLVGQNIITIPENKCAEYVYPMKKLANRKELVFISQGGGNMGELYKYQEQRRLMLIRHIKDCPIIVFPQSVDYTYGTKAHCKARKLYQNNPHLSLYARDDVSYEKMQELFPDCRIVLVPDIVTSLNKSEDTIDRAGILFCLRSDREANSESKTEIKKILELLKDEKYEMIDTYNAQFAGSYEGQKAQIESFWNKMRTAKLVVTDRLHGMIFSMITDTPCVAFDNSTGKVSAFYHTWLSDVPGIVLYDNNLDKIEDFAFTVLKENISLTSIKDLSNEFKQLKEELKNFM